MISNLVVASVEELNQTQTMSERVSEHRNLAPCFSADCLLDHGARRLSAREPDLDFIYDDVEVHRRPVPLIGAAALAGTDRTGLLAQKEEGSWPAPSAPPRPSRTAALRRA